MPHTNFTIELARKMIRNMMVYNNCAHLSYETYIAHFERMALL